MVEGRARRHFRALHDLAHAFSLHFEGAVMRLGDSERKAVER